MQKLRQIHYQILSDGRDFSLIAGKYSDGLYAKNKGYAGYMELKTFPKSIRQSLEEAEINMVLPPYYMNGSYYIFKLTERTVSMVKLMIVQVDIKATDYTIKRIK
ncbi:MAG TPA: peptidylprolyl isomerase, partial [Candidatus Cloacimonadota bacterium]|nr:peptidylprolyl isomerase [Candidatus Cloacimonadota bacterium]